MAKTARCTGATPYAGTGDFLVSAVDNVAMTRYRAPSNSSKRVCAVSISGGSAFFVTLHTVLPFTAA